MLAAQIASLPHFLVKKKKKKKKESGHPGKLCCAQRRTHFKINSMFGECDAEAENHSVS